MDRAEFAACRGRVETELGEIGYVDTGSGPVALFVHGVGTGAYLWRNVLGALRGERRCVALDLPLHGASPARPGQDFSLPGLAAVVEACCEALELTGFDLVANDTGGAVAQVFATRRPDLLRTFALTNCDAHDNLPPEAFRPTVELAERGRIAALAPRITANFELGRPAIGAGYEHPDRLDVATIREYLEPLYRTPERAREFERFLTSLKGEDLLAVEPELAKLEVPTLIAWGTGDQFFETRWAYWLRDTIPGVTEVAEIEGGKLFFPDERASELVALLRRHWAAQAG
ncbi:alpha/beta fold hydrolase [Amycolatopsis anabasis]|uniref:alpha/beta fold hydrolase n=1 Tax=Amycolatopsis anabasis TaxID=1840409 RepID=UPI00131BD281|nr:alpha/beta hydrolase [Amycolatopsis anabasis]